MAKSKKPEKLLLSPTKSFELKLRRLEVKQQKQEDELRARRFKDTRTSKAGNFLTRVSQFGRRSNFTRSRKPKFSITRTVYPSIPRYTNPSPVKSYTDEINDAANLVP